MDLVAIIDTETTALTPEEGTCIEVALVRYSIKHTAVVEAFSWLLEAESNEAEHINHIPPGLLVAPTAHEANGAWELVADRAEVSDAILAHNADFDRQWAPDWFSKVPTPWIDTCGGVDWPLQSKPGSSLINLCLEHGLGVVDPHRALNDCLLLARLLTRCAELGHDLDKILARGLRPTATFQALVSFHQKDAAKEAGFHWEPKTKQWLRKMAIEDAEKLPFRVANLDHAEAREAFL